MRLPPRLTPHPPQRQTRPTLGQVPAESPVNATPSSKLATLLVLAAALFGVITLLLAAPMYLTQRGFPVDDAWIHAVYARSLAQSGHLAYNPGTPATGETSPLWAGVLALPHLLAPATAAAVLLTKVLGLALHVATALVLRVVLERAAGARWLAVAGAALVAVHPDLLAAAVSGMEVPLATLISALLVADAQAARWRRYALWSLLAPLARPEIGLFALLLPVGLHVGRSRVAVRQGVVAGLGGVGASWLGLGLRNQMVSGHPLPATFYAKVTRGTPTGNRSVAHDFANLLGHLTLFDSIWLIVGMLGLALWSLRRGQRVPGLLWGLGLLFCVVSCALIPPLDPNAFYHQRYVVPALPFLIAPLPLLLANPLATWQARWRDQALRVVVAGLVVWTLVAGWPRYLRLDNDARNIDDVQVRLGQALAHADPQSTVWVTDAGATRFFGAPMVVDLMGLNSPELLEPDAQTWLDSHPPQHMALMPAWLELAPETLALLDVQTLAAQSRYTVTSDRRMQEQWLVRCPPGVSGNFRLLGRELRFRCAGAHG